MCQVQRQPAFEAVYGLLTFAIRRLDQRLGPFDVLKAQANFFVVRILGTKFLICECKEVLGADLTSNSVRHSSHLGRERTYQCMNNI